MMHAPTNIYLNVKSHGFQNKMDIVFIITNGHGKLIRLLYFFTYGKAYFHTHINHIRYAIIHSPVLE